MPLSTNSVKPKDNNSYAKFMREVRDEQSGATAVISNIPRQVITTKTMRPAKPLVIPKEFPLVNKVAQKAPAQTFFSTGMPRPEPPTFADLMDTKATVTSASAPSVAPQRAPVKRAPAKRTTAKRAARKKG